MPEYLFALTVRGDQDGSIAGDPFRLTRDVIVGYNTELSMDPPHAGVIGPAKLRSQRDVVEDQVQALVNKNPNARMGILDFAEALLPSAADARLSQRGRWEDYVASTPGVVDRDADYECRVRMHLRSVAESCRRAWDVPWGFPTFPGARLFGLADGGRTDFCGYPRPGSPFYGTHFLQRENDRVLVPILETAGCVIVQAGYFEAQYEPGYDGRHWEAGMFDSGRLRRADVEDYIRSMITEGFRLAGNAGVRSVVVMASPYLRGRTGGMVNPETWDLLQAIAAEDRVPIVLWAAFQRATEIATFRAWAETTRVKLPAADI